MIAVNHESSIAPVRLGLIGTGSAARRYYLEACKRLPEIDLAAVCDAFPARAREFAAEAGCDAHDTLEEFLARDDVEAVCVVTQVQDHCAPTVAACQAGKHVLCEKPMAATLGEADDMIVAAREAGVVLAGVFQMRASNHFSLLREKISQGALGTIHTVDITYRQAFNPRTREEHPDKPGVLVNMMIHDLDFARAVIGEPVEVEHARVEHRHPELDPPFEDLVLAELRFASGARGVVNGCESGVCAGARAREIVIVGDGGCARLSSFEIQSMATINQDGDPVEITVPPIERTDHAGQLRDFAIAVREGRPPLVTGEDHRESLRLMLSILRKSGVR